MKEDSAVLTGPLADKAKAIEALQTTLVEELERRSEERDNGLIEKLEKMVDEKLADLRTDIEKEKDATRLDGAPPAGTGEGEWSLFRTINALATKDWSNAPVEKEVGDAMRAKATMALGTDTLGGYIVPENYTAEIIEKLEQDNPLIQMGVRVLPGISGSPLIIPKQTGSATASYISEGSTISATNPTLGQIEFSPRTLAAMVDINNVLRENANPDVENFVRQDLIQQFDNAITTYGLTGNGAGGQPIGILNEPNINTVDFATPVTATFDSLVDFVYALMEDNALRGSLGWIMHPSVLQHIWKMKDNVDLQEAGSPGAYVNTQPLERRVLSDGPLTTLLGYPYATTTAMPSTETSIVFGDWSQMLMPTWKTLELRASDVAGTSFEKDQLKVRALMRHDMGVRHAESFCMSLNYND